VLPQVCAADYRHEDFQEWHMELSGIGYPTWMAGSQVASTIASRFLPHEWVCEYCGRANGMGQCQCGSCGWYRGLIADVVKEAGIWRTK